MPTHDSLGRTRRRVLVVLLALAILGHAHWFFGNLYEAVVLIPQFAAAPEQRLPISAALVGVYIITQLNFPLFFEVGTGAAQLEVLLRRWAILNYVRVGLVGVDLVLLLLALVSATRTGQPQSAQEGVR